MLRKIHGKETMNYTTLVCGHENSTGHKLISICGHSNLKKKSLHLQLIAADYLWRFSSVSCPSSSEHLGTSRVGCSSDIHSCKHSGPIRNDAVRAWDQGRRGRKKDRERKRYDSAKSTRGKCCVQYRDHVQMCWLILTKSHWCQHCQLKTQAQIRTLLLSGLKKIHFGTKTVNKKQFMLITRCLIILCYI